MIGLILFIYSLISCTDPGVEIQRDPLNFLALGDSYTIGQSVAEEFRWPNILRDSLESKGIPFNKPQIIAKTGWRTDQLMTAATAEATANDYGLVSLLIGVNNQFQGRSVDDYRPEFEDLLEFAIERAGGDANKVIVLSIPDYGCTPFGASNAENIGRALDEFNAANKEITLMYGVRYFGITGISREAKNDPELIASDNLHPSAKQYNLWVGEVLKSEELLSILEQ